MFSKESWFEGLISPDGIHVKAKTYNSDFSTNSLVYGRLDSSGGMYIADVYVKVLDFIPANGVWQKHPGIESVRYLWNEANYDLIVPQNIQEGDYILFGDNLVPITSVEKPKDASVYGVMLTYSVNGYSFKEKYNTYALRANNIPTEPGLYKDEQGGYRLLNSADGNWYKLKRIPIQKLSNSTLTAVEDI